MVYPPQGSATAPTAVAVLLTADDTELSTTSTSYTTIKSFRFVKNSNLGFGWKKLIIFAEARQETSGHTVYLGVYINNTLRTELSWTETVYTLKTATIDISTVADGIITFEARCYVTGGTGYLRLLEVYGGGLIMKVRIKDVELIADDKLVLVKLDADGIEFSFAIDLWEIYDPVRDDIDTDRIREVLLHWKNKVIPRRIAVEAKNRNDKIRIIDKMKGIEV